jgi:predicted HAD superfamily Cof-like phosphohydrolase
MNMFDYIRAFIKKFGFDKDFDSLEKVEFAFDLISEEFEELENALEELNAEEFIDALGDLSWLCNKLMYQLDVDPDRVYSEIGLANLTKERGIKEGREQSGGFDVIKPIGWKSPDHSNNHGKLDDIFKS